MKRSARQFFIFLLILNAVFVIGILAVFTLASGMVEKKSQKIAQLKADTETNDQAIANYKVLSATIKANEDLQNTLDKVLPADKYQSEAFADLDKFSKNTGMPVQQISFNTGTNKGTGKTLTSPTGIKGVSAISVILHCNNAHYDSLLSFLKQIENTQRRMQVTSIAITPNSTTPNLLDRVDLSIDIYIKSGS
jgi:Tfp pilus assembly protein PilO